ncbi:hypothetical protein QCA50_006632 [Cerrena zonata]|uniref:Uncharacterized protein n=1 Tax=Cerrena zonata TaxID=2478898 RepID=A0AAW0GFP3_9APHY
MDDSTAPISSSSPTGTPPSFEDLRRDICILTVILKNHREGHPTSIKNRRNKLTNLFSHVSTMLAIDATNDPFASRVNAVTGFVQDDQIISAVFTPNTNAFDKSEGAVTQLVVGENGRELIFKWKENNHVRILPDQHLLDIISILHFLFSSTSNDIKRTLLIINLHLFLLARVYRKLAGRFDNGIKAWSKHPLCHIRDWYSSGSHPLDLSEPKTIKAQSLGSLITALLSSQNVEADQQGNFHLTSENAKSWAHVLGRLADKMDWLREYVPDKRDRRKVSTRTPSSSEIEDLHDTILSIGALIRTGVVDALISEDLERDLLSSCEHAQNISIMPSGYDIVTGQNDNAQEVDIDGRNLGDDEIYETAHETSEKPREHVIRYLETLTAWFDASVTLIVTNLLETIGRLQIHCPASKSFCLCRRNHCIQKQLSGWPQ